MSLATQASDFVRAQARAHLGKNIRRYSWATWTGEVTHNSLGGVRYLSPAQGTVVANDDDGQFVLVKTGMSEFRVILKELLDTPVGVGDKVSLEFYQVRRFDGSLADGSEDPSLNGFYTMMLGGWFRGLFPVKWEGRYLGIDARFENGYKEIKNPYLMDLIEQMETLTVDDGWRSITGILVDAKASNLEFVDPDLDADTATQDPAIQFAVRTEKFGGVIRIAYSRAADAYFIEASSHTGEVEKRDDVFFDALGQTLIDLIDDRNWLKVKTTITKRAPKARAKAVA